VCHALVIQLPVVHEEANELLDELTAGFSALPILIYEPDSGVSQPDLTALKFCDCIRGEVSPDSLAERVANLIGRQSKPANPVTQADRGYAKGLVGSSPAMRQVIEIIGMVGPRRSTVLITGETGSGKELAARAIHAASPRRDTRMVAINCAALPDHLLEAELFGHTKGAFTGALNARVGLFEQAQRGTIFLDEIGEMPLQLQSKLLRVLQEREVLRIGSSEPIPVDVRVIAASNTNLLEAVAAHRFREDLYYRLNVVALRMPPLRERTADIPELAQHFLAKIAELESSPRKQISPEALDALQRYSWPGNVRQLEHALESAIALTGDRMLLRSGDLDLHAEIPSSELAFLALDLPEGGVDFEELIAGIERRLLERALAKSGGNKARAANMLRMKRTTLISKFKSLEVCA
jgi:transcriptional regulator with PAS, ATPase and Fis domain